MDFANSLKEPVSRFRFRMTPHRFEAHGTNVEFANGVCLLTPIKDRTC